MSLIKMWSIFEKTGNIEAYLYDKINRDNCETEVGTLALKNGALDTLQQKDGTEG